MVCWQEKWRRHPILVFSFNKTIHYSVQLEIFIKENGGMISNMAKDFAFSNNTSFSFRYFIIVKMIIFMMDNLPTENVKELVQNFSKKRVILCKTWFKPCQLSWSMWYISWRLEKWSKRWPRSLLLVLNKLNVQMFTVTMVTNTLEVIMVISEKEKALIFSIQY